MIAWPFRPTHVQGGQRCSSAASPLPPLDFEVVVVLVSEGKKTRLTLHMTFADSEAFRTAVERYGVLAGGTQTLDRLAFHLQSR